jgi:hypothetical protein
MNGILLRALIALVPACCFPVRSSCFLEEGVCGVFYSCSAQDVSRWSFLLMCPKHFTCFLGCIGGWSIASGTTSIYRHGLHAQN